MKTKTSKNKVSSTVDVRNKSMTMSQIKQKAISVGVQPDNMSKTELIRSIQKAEGYSPCFGTSNGNCPYTDCCFMADCLTIKC
jgi:hypothetical protein